MSSWGVQLVIGKLVTDDTFRQRFEAQAPESLMRLCEQGIALSDSEFAGFLETDRRIWSSLAKQIDTRLRRVRVSKGSRSASRGSFRSLTERERSVLHSVFEGRTNKEIARDLSVSESAVKATLQQLFRKTQVRTRAQLVRAVVEGPLGLTSNAR